MSFKGVHHDPTAELYSFEQPATPANNSQKPVLSNTENFQLRASQPTEPNNAPAKVVADIANQKITGIHCPHELSYGLENVDYNMQQGQTVGLLGDCIGAMGKLTEDMKLGIQAPANESKAPISADNATSLTQQAAMEALEKNDTHTQRANLELNKFSPSGPC